MKQYSITKSVPVPEGRGSSRSRFPLERMKKGDSFLIPFSDMPNMNKPHQVVPYSRARAIGIKLTTQQRRHGLRVWRIA